jgi:hypothetical protein
MSDQDSLGKLLEAKAPFKNEPKTIVKCLVNTCYISLVCLSMPSTFNQPNTGKLGQNKFKYSTLMSICSVP